MSRQSFSTSKPTVSNVDERKEGSGWNILLFTTKQAVDISRGGVQLLHLFHKMIDRPVNHRRLQRREAEVRLFVPNEIPRCLLGNGLGDEISIGSIVGFLGRHWIPVRLGIGVARARAFGSINDGSE